MEALKRVWGFCHRAMSELCTDTKQATANARMTVPTVCIKMLHGYYMYLVSRIPLAQSESTANQYPACYSAWLQGEF